MFILKYKPDLQVKKSMGAQLRTCLGLKSYHAVASEDIISEYGDSDGDTFDDIALELDEVLDENPGDAKTL